MPCFRIIPADAGNTLRVDTVQVSIEDHPRGCGEHVWIVLGCFADHGSSPRMRGTRCPDDHMHVGHGIIPADAGNTSKYDKSLGEFEDHPRGCGEHSIMTVIK